MEETNDWKRRYDEQRKDFKDTIQNLQKIYQSGK
jgi:hypothetical protein